MTAFTLKTIALAAMLIDHLVVAFPDIFPFWFRAVGRLAWPVFAYLLAEGFRHTKVPKKFLMRLLVFAVLSEIPYDLVMGSPISFIANTNIFYTLFLGGMAIYLYERLKKRHGRQAVVVIAAAVIAAAIVADILSVDYGGIGVLFIFAMYAIKTKITRLVAMGAFALSQFMPLVLAHSWGMEIRWEHLLMRLFALTTVLLVAMYNDKRGQSAKWLFYWFYPAHLAVLAVIVMILNYSP